MADLTITVGRQWLGVGPAPVRRVGCLGDGEVDQCKQFKDFHSCLVARMPWEMNNMVALATPSLLPARKYPFLYTY